MWSSRTPFGNTPPEACHITLPPEKLLPGRVIVVGDIHGCLKEFNQLLDTCEYKHEHDNLILAGDIINKGPNSVDVLRRARELKATVIRGNHEDACIALRKRFKVVSSLSSSYKWLKQLTDADMAYLGQLPFTVTLPSHKVIVVHAGFLPDGTPVHQQSMKNMLFLEDVERDGKDNKLKCHYKAKADNMSWARFWKGPCHVLFGHAASKAVQYYDFATGLDTGCCGGGSLTACILPPASELEQKPEFQAYLRDAADARGPTRSELHAKFKQVAKIATSGRPSGLVTSVSEDLCCSSMGVVDSLRSHDSDASSVADSMQPMGSTEFVQHVGTSTSCVLPQTNQSSQGPDAPLPQAPFLAQRSQSVQLP